MKLSIIGYVLKVVYFCEVINSSGSIVPIR